MCDEAIAFAERCANQTRELNAMRTELRWRRGLVFRWEPTLHRTHGVGLNHLLTMVLQVHALCIALRRYCYVSVLDAELEAYFGYADGSSWAPLAQELHRYPKAVQLRLRFRGDMKVSPLMKATPSHNKPAEERWHDIGFLNEVERDAHFFKTTLYNLLSKNSSLSNVSLIELTLRGSKLPLLRKEHIAHLRKINTVHGSAASTHPNLHAINLGLDACQVRYFTQPLLHRPALAQLQAEGVHGVVHFRTGFADVIRHPSDTNAGLPTTGSRVRRAAWVRAACNESPVQGSGRPRILAISDSPGLLTELVHQHPHALRTLNYTTDVQTTRTWGATSSEAKFRAMDAIVAASRASSLFVAPQRSKCICWSEYRLRKNFYAARRMLPCFQWAHCMEDMHTGFYRSAVSRSICIQEVKLSVPWCPEFARIFPRDMASSLSRTLGAAPGKSGARELAWEGWQSLQRGQPHPCANVSTAECYNSLVAVLQA